MPMSDRPSDWYVAALLDACAEQLEAFHDKDDAYRNLILRARDVASALMAEDSTLKP
jgi:hypothetical protein